MLLLSLLPFLSVDASSAVYNFCEGATMRLDDWMNLYRISIHVPTQGATQRINSRLRMILYFNPRSCEGATKVSAQSAETSAISIHAPAKERLQNCTKIPFVLSFLLDNYTHSILFKQAFPFAFTSNHSDFHVFLVRIS